MGAGASGRDSKLRHWLADEARAHGFDVVAIASADAIDDARKNLTAYLENDYHGTMSWMAETAERRSRPTALWPDVETVIVFAMNYGPDSNPLDTLALRDRAAISVYAQNRDYHDLIKGRLKTIAGRFAARTGAQVKVFVDTAPVMEKPLAQASGVGWQGKHTNLVSREHGSWLFLGSIFTTAALRSDDAEIDHCGSCRACVDICPTKAFPRAYQIDARRCISYLTIEHKGVIALEFRKPMGNRIYGCDDCLAVCPWNKFAQMGQEAKLQARDDLRAPELRKLLELDDPAFRKLFTGSPIKRIGRERFIRNCLIAAGNSEEPQLVEICRKLLADPSPLVRGAAVWALSRLIDKTAFDALRDRISDSETDPDVLAEWSGAASRLELVTESH